MEYYKSEVKSGCFIVLAVFVLVALLMWLGEGKRRLLNTTTYVVQFTNVSQIRNNSPVYMYGKVVGRVSDTRPRQNYAEVVIELDSAIKIYENAKFEAKQINLLGQLFVFVNPGTPSDPARPEKRNMLLNPMPGDTDEVAELKKARRLSGYLKGSIGTSLQVVMENAQKLSYNINEVIATLKNKEEDLLQAMIDLAKQYAQLGKRLNENLDDNKKKILLTLSHLEAITLEFRKFIVSNSKNIEALLVETKEAIAVSKTQVEQNGAKLKKLLESLHSQIERRVDPLLENLAKLTSDLDETLAGNQRSIYDTMRNIREVSNNLKVLSAKLSADPSLLIFGTGEKPSEYRKRAKDAREFRDKGRMPLFGHRK